MPPAPDPAGDSMPPPVSVVVCAFTLERIDRIAAAIESLLAQTVQRSASASTCDGFWKRR